MLRFVSQPLLVSGTVVAHDTMGNLQLLHVCLSFPFVLDKTVKSALLAKQRSCQMATVQGQLLWW